MKNLTLLLFLGLSAFQLDAQDPVRKVHFGVTVNPQINLSSFGSGESVEKANSISYVASADVYFDLSSRLQLRTGLGVRSVTLNHRDRSARWPSQGQNGEYVPDGSYIGYNTNNFFAGMPVNLKLKFNDKPNHIYIIGGLSGNFLIASGGEIVINESGHVWTQYFDDFLHEIHSFYATASVAVGYEMKLGKVKFFLEPNLENSIKDFFKNETPARANGKVLLAGIRTGAYF